MFGELKLIIHLGADISFSYEVIPRLESLGTGAIRKYPCGLNLGELQNTSLGPILNVRYFPMLSNTKCNPILSAASGLK